MGRLQELREDAGLLGGGPASAEDGRWSSRLTELMSTFIAKRYSAHETSIYSRLVCRRGGQHYRGLVTSDSGSDSVSS